MSKHSRAQRTVAWNVRSVSVRKRDAQHRLAQVFRVLLDGRDRPSTPDSKVADPSANIQQEEADARRHLCESLDRASTTAPDY
jgi:hypothetical protein